MVTSVVDRATSNMLIGPDWTLNMEICDMLNCDPGQGKDAIKCIKRRIGTKKSKVQLLALMLLETIVKNCGDIVHMHVAEKGLPREMVKILQKKPDYQVKEKIVFLIDTWQEAFSGQRARYPQYFAAYQDLLHGGSVFPQRSDKDAPVLTPPQSHPLSSYSQNVHTSENNHEGTRAGSSAEGKSSNLSLSEIQKVRSSVDVLTEMLSAINLGNKEALRQEALVDLVEQCRTCKPRVVHLVNSTADESLLCQGLTLHDELQRVLAKYESVLSGVSVQLEKPKPEPTPQDRVTVESPLADAGEISKQANGRYTSEASALTKSLIALPAANGTPTPPKAEVKMDLLSVDLLGGGDYNSPMQNSLALSAPKPASPVASDQNDLALVDLLSMGSNPPNPSNSLPALVSGTEFQKQQQQHLHPQQGSVHQNGMTPNMTSLHEQSGYQQASRVSWGAQTVQLQQQQPSPLYQNGINPQMGSPVEQSGFFYPQVFDPSWGAQSTQLQQQPPSPLQQNGMTPSMGSAHEQSGYPQVSSPSWGAQSVSLQQQPSSSVHGAQNGGSFPLPPWESQATDIQPLGNTFSSAMIISKTGNPQSPRMQTLGLPTAWNEQQIVGMFVQPITGSQLMALNQSFQMPTIYAQPMQGSQMMGMLSQAMQENQMASMDPQQMYGNQMAGYGYGGYGQQQHQDAHYLEQGMYTLSLKDESALSLTSSNPSQLSIAPYMPPVKQQPKACDLLFGDLLDIAKVKPAKTPPGGNWSM